MLRYFLNDWPAELFWPAKLFCHLKSYVKTENIVLLPAFVWNRSTRNITIKNPKWQNELTGKYDPEDSAEFYVWLLGLCGKRRYLFIANTVDHCNSCAVNVNRNISNCEFLDDNGTIVEDLTDLTRQVTWPKWWASLDLTTYFNRAILRYVTYIHLCYVTF